MLEDGLPREMKNEKLNVLFFVWNKNWLLLKILLNFNLIFFILLSKNKLLAIIISNDVIKLLRNKYCIFNNHL